MNFMSQKRYEKIESLYLGYAVRTLCGFFDDKATVNFIKNSLKIPEKKEDCQVSAISIILETADRFTVRHVGKDRTTVETHVIFPSVPTMINGDSLSPSAVADSLFASIEGSDGKFNEIYDIVSLDVFEFEEPMEGMEELFPAQSRFNLNVPSSFSLNLAIEDNNLRMEFIYTSEVSYRRLTAYMLERKDRKGKGESL